MLLRITAQQYFNTATITVLHRGVSAAVQCNGVYKISLSKILTGYNAGYLDLRGGYPPRRGATSPTRTAPWRVSPGTIDGPTPSNPLARGN